MLAAWRSEILGLLAVGLVLLLLGLFLGRTEVLLGAGLVAYVGWHLFNLVLLQRWISNGCWLVIAAIP